MSQQPPAPQEQTAQVIEAFRDQIQEDVDKGIDAHEAKMTKLGFLFLGIFVAVIVVAALLP